MCKNEEKVLTFFTLKVLLSKTNCFRKVVQIFDYDTYVYKEEDVVNNTTKYIPAVMVDSIERMSVP